MPKVAVELINIDEDLAEKAVGKMIDALALIAQPIKKSILIEPHDETRGIWAKFELKDPEESTTSSYRQALVAAVKSFLLMHTHINNKVNVHVTVYNDKGDNE